MMYTWRQLQAAKPRLGGDWQRKTAIREPVEMCERRFGYLPARFRYRGSVQLVQRIVHVWEDPGSGKRSARRYFKILCADATTRTLFQDLRSGTWHVAP
ncbi:MAG: hypothetical protein HC822_13340 [Oscillochloris sp.]|nr:hypothetical protein [Oscillochloris sp.]